MDTEQAIRKLEPQLQEPYRILAAKKLKQIQQGNNKIPKTMLQDTQVIKNIKKN
jgi:hypothetical protein